jgi:hypothetical protein
MNQERGEYEDPQTMQPTTLFRQVLSLKCAMLCC